MSGSYINNDHHKISSIIITINNYSGKLRHGPLIIQLKTDGGWSISEYLSIRKMRLCLIHTWVVSVNMVSFNYANDVT